MSIKGPIKLTLTKEAFNTILRGLKMSQLAGKGLSSAEHFTLSLLKKIDSGETAWDCHLKNKDTD